MQADKTNLLNNRDGYIESEVKFTSLVLYTVSKYYVLQSQTYLQVSMLYVTGCPGALCEAEAPTEIRLLIRVQAIDLFELIKGVDFYNVFRFAFANSYFVVFFFV